MFFMNMIWSFKNKLELADVSLLKEIWLTGQKLGFKLILTALDGGFDTQNNKGSDKKGALKSVWVARQKLVSLCAFWLEKTDR